MQSYILVASHDEEITAYVDALKQKETISAFDAQEITLEEEATKKKTAKKSLGIETVKSIQQDVYLTPHQGKKKLLTIRDAHLLTIEAQNALLKLLEEPPAHLIVILVTNTPSALLPTIHSRCFMVTLKDTSRAQDLTPEEQEILTDLSIKTVFELADKKGKSKEEALAWIKQTILQLRNKLHMTSDHAMIEQYSTLLKKLLIAHQTIADTNISPRMAIESLLLTTSY